MKLLKPRVFIFFFLLAGCCFLSTCTYEKATPTFNGYPDEVGKLVYTKCATAGCHTDASKEAAGGLSMESWESLFKGGHSGAAVIPYRSDFSTMCYFTNTFSDLGTIIGPTMPYGRTPLTRDEVLLLKNWIDAGAPSKENFVKFSDNPNRSKYYVTNQGCDVVTVFDAETGLQMRMVNVGQTAGTEAPHMVRVSPDKKYWYVLSLDGLYLEQYSTTTDQLTGKATIGPGYWNAFTISSDSHTAYCSDMSDISSGKVAIVNLDALTSYTLQPFNYPHGMALDAADDTLYITQQVGSNQLYKVPIADFSALSNVNLYAGTPPVLYLNPHEVIFAPDHSKYFVTCQSSSDVRVFETGTDRLLAIIPVGASPTEMSFSLHSNNLFVSCTEDTLTFPGQRGSVAVIDYVNNTFKKAIYTGWQPHGIIVDDERNLVIVANRNFSTDGPAPHHANACGGRNGYVTFIDINTLETVKNFTGTADKKIEVSVDPYSVAKK
ncbi:MAG: hypothetical protein JWP12_3866 [Bacteroidetes bacterium]|nr:hypothetical protein [Bacteroidota bacterium]